jgi:PAB-dependent poly(A)-specific ribonuclease subunit 2
MSTSTSYKPISPITFPSLSGLGAAVTALSFDPVSDILWTGSNSGHVSACYGTQGVRGASFQVGGNTVKKIIAGDNYIRALGTASTGLGSWSKGGMNKWYFRSGETNSLSRLKSKILQVSNKYHCIF